MKTVLPVLLLAAFAAAFATTPPTRQAAPSPKGLLNMSLRAQVPSGSQIISGFVLDQNGTVIIRAAGPALGAFGVGTAMSDPVLQVWKDNQMIAQNDNWDATTGAAAAAGVGAFPFQAGSKDAAIVMTLAAGAYTAVITDSPASTNRVGREVLLEVYNATVQ